MKLESIKLEQSGDDWKATAVVSSDGVSITGVSIHSRPLVPARQSFINAANGHRDNITPKISVGVVANVP